MNIFIPEIGTRFVLTENWKFTLHAERRNVTMFEVLLPEKMKAAKEKKTKLLARYKELEKKVHKDARARNSVYLNDSKYYSEYTKVQKEYWNSRDATDNLQNEAVAIAAGTVLEVDRIYIRQGAKGFSSVTFKIRKKKVIRFWVKLEDVNTIQCKIEGPVDKYPEGKFSIQRDNNNYTVFYQSSQNASGRFGSGWGFDNTNAKDERKNSEVARPLRWKGWGNFNDYDSYEKFIAGCERLSVPKFLRDEFDKKFQTIKK